MSVLTECITAAHFSVNGLTLGLLCKGSKYFDFWKSSIPLVLAVPVAILSYAIQRRNSYLQALRDLWKLLLPTVQLAIQYSHLNAPTQQEFSSVQKDLSIAIDVLRGVFCNISSRDGKGLYPYENLKDIQSIITWLGFGPNFRPIDSPSARSCIVGLWQEMFSAMLTEFDRDEPTIPVSKYLYDSKQSSADLLKESKIDLSGLKAMKRPSM